jgi:RNA-directed DNA polymerase
VFRAEASGRLAAAERKGDPRLIKLIRRWLKASVLEDGEIQANEEGTPQGCSISVMLHYTLDL